MRDNNKTRAINKLTILRETKKRKKEKIINVFITVNSTLFVTVITSQWNDGNVIILFENFASLNHRSKNII